MLIYLAAKNALLPPQAGRDGSRIIRMDEWNVPEGQLSLPQEMTTRLLSIRTEHAAWAYTTGTAETGRGRICNLFKQGSELSMWWCSLLYERHPKVTPELYDLYRLRALELVMLELGADGLATYGISTRCVSALKGLCSRRRWRFSDTATVQGQPAKSRFRRLYDATPAPLRAAGRFCWWLASVFRHLTAKAPLPSCNEKTGTVVTYFPNIDLKKAEDGILRSRYWESLHDAFDERTPQGTPPPVRWLFVRFPSPQATLRQCVRFLDRFRQTQKSGISFSYIEEFLGIKDLAAAWVRYSRIALASRKAEGSIRSLFHFAGSELNFWPLLGWEYAETFRGWRCLERTLQQRGIENYVRLAGPQKWYTFPLENCPWERMVTSAAHRCGASPVLGAQHSTIRPTDFRYFDDPATWRDPETAGFQPDLVIGNGEGACSQWRQAGVPPERLRMTEALRYLYLAGSPRAEITGRPDSLLVVTSFFADETEAHLELLAEAMKEGLLDSFTVTVKPHPYLPVEKRLRELLGSQADRLQFSTVPVAEALQNNPLVWASNSTTVALEAAIKGLPVIVMQPSGDFDLCPLQDVPGLLRTSSLSNLKDALDKAAPLPLAPDYLLLDKGLARWRTMLSLASQQ